MFDPQEIKGKLKEKNMKTANNLVDAANTRADVQKKISTHNLQIKQ